ncbi:hypothetical protein [Cryobacterium sp. CAN_C2]|uniref:hypothetical protein n=1 Tax=Cryobacterium sp. CAN_C2 TaxID=2787723 RepID=UPI0018C8DEA2
MIGATTEWGLDYLFGLVEADESFRAFSAHTWAEEKVALTDFLANVAKRRAQFPGMHVHHYAAYERTHLLSLAARHGVGEDQIDQMLRENVLVNPYPLGGEIEAQRMFDSITDRNRYDYLSTLRLRNWMLVLARMPGIHSAGTATEADVDPVKPSPVREALLDLATVTAGTTHTPRSADQTAASCAAAAIDYHRREQKSFWWGHYFRLEDPIERWQDTRDVLVVEHADVERDWFRDGQQRVERRHLWLRGRLAPGSSSTPGDQAGPHLLYEYPGPFTNPDTAEGARTHRCVKVREVTEGGDIVVEETLQKVVACYSHRPSALAPAAQPRPMQQKPAIDEWADAIVDARPGWPRDPMVDILRRIPPCTRIGDLAPESSDGQTADAVIATLRDLDDSYQDVQGPPGTGTTYLGSAHDTE